MNEEIKEMFIAKRAAYEAQLLKIDFKKWDRNEHLNDVMNFLELDVDLSDQAYFNSILNMPYDEVMKMLNAHVLWK